MRLFDRGGKITGAGPVIGCKNTIRKSGIFFIAILKGSVPFTCYEKAPVDEAANASVERVRRISLRMNDSRGVIDFFSNRFVVDAQAFLRKHYLNRPFLA